MKKLLAVSVSVLLLLSATALAAPSPEKGSSAGGKTIIGTVSRVDTNQRLMVIKNGAGKEATVYWSDSTKFEGGQVQEGANVTVTVEEQGGKTLAKSVQLKEPNKPY